MVRATTPGLALLAACFSPAPEPGAPCATGDRCPAPLACIAGVCTRPAAGPDAAGSDGGPSDAPNAAPIVCDAPFATTPSGACHLDRTMSATWLAAEQDCEQLGAHLAVPETVAEAMEIRSQRWIGVTDLALEGTYRAVTGAAVSFTYWAIGEPSGGGSFSGDCAFADPQARWHISPCDFPFEYVCERDGRPADPSAY